MKLNDAMLAELPISKPGYDREQVSVGIVHFGVGGFHHAHQAMYIDRVLEKGLAHDWVVRANLVSAYTWALDSLHRDGARATMRGLMAVEETVTS